MPQRWFVAILWLISVSIFSEFFYQTTATKHLDSVFLFQGVAAILEHGSPTSAIVASWQDAFKFFNMAPAEVCEANLLDSGRAPYNVLHNHGYFALYPIAMVSSLVGAERAFALLNAAAHLAIVFLPYTFLRRQGLGALSSAVFSILVVAYPGWALSASGDYYLDRLYVPLALLLLYMIHERAEANPQQQGRSWGRIVLLVTLAAASLTERAAIMVMGTVLFFLVFYPKIRTTSATRWPLITVLGLLTVYVLFYFTFVYRGIEGGGDLVKSANFDLTALNLKLKHPGFLPFVLTNLLFLGCLALFSGVRNIVLLAGAMLPNVLMNIGGAELTGWSTHYHAMYMPFLVFAASVGYLYLMKNLKPVVTATFCLLAMLYTILLTQYYDPYTAQWGARGSSLTSGFGVSGSVYRFFVTPKESGEKAISEWAASVETVVPQGSKVSVVESMMPVLYRSRQLSMFPVGMDSADFLVVSGTAQHGVITSATGAVSYLGQAAADRLNACLYKRAADQGFVLLKEVPAIGVLVFKRSQLQPSRV